MLRRHKLLILILVILLVPILVGMIPLNMAHRLASVDHFVHGKQSCKNHCPFNSLASYNDHGGEALDSTQLGPYLQASQEVCIPILHGSAYNTAFTLTPLRC
jgi:hypothetical protein